LPASGSPTVRRRELGALLRALRTGRGWTVEHVAERLMVSASKISRQETGQRGVSQRDIRDLCDLYEVDDALRAQLTDLAAEGKQQAWWQSRHLPYSSYVDLESEAALIRDFGLGLVPGLLQTADYARVVLQTIRPTLSAEVVEERLRGRLDRQQRVFDSPGRTRFEAVIDEAVLHRVASSEAIMRAQLQHLVEASRRPNISVRVMPYEAGLLPATNNKFIILSFSQPALSEVVFIEGLTGDLYLDRPEDVATYTDAFQAMLEMTSSVEDSRAIISRIAANLAE
jgi:transcriptional regulator with XRE-family HTH domain